MRADEIAGALDGMGSAQGTQRNPAPAPNSESVLRITGFKVGRSKNAQSSMSGQLYAVMDFEVEQSDSSKTPPASAVSVFFAGLDSKKNNGNLAATNQESLRRLVGAVVGCDPNGPAPQVPATPDNPNPLQGWHGITAFLAANEKVVIGRRIRLIAGNAKEGKPVFPDQMQFLGVS